MKSRRRAGFNFNIPTLVFFFLFFSHRCLFIFLCCFFVFVFLFFGISSRVCLVKLGSAACLVFFFTVSSSSSSSSSFFYFAPACRTLRCVVLHHFIVSAVVRLRHGGPHPSHPLPSRDSHQGSNTSTTWSAETAETGSAVTTPATTRPAALPGLPRTRAPAAASTPGKQSPCGGTRACPEACSQR